MHRRCVNLRKYSDTKTNKILHILLIIVLLFCLIICLFHKQLSEHMSEICEYKGWETANHIIAEAVNEQLTGSDQQQYITIIRDENEKIICYDNVEKIG